ncbi:MAG TPA: hypothetical protein PK765_07060 [bacterium]|nr:hypothetical protein [bacterium]
MSDTQASETKRRTEEALAIVEEATEGRSVIDIATASMVVAAFGYFVGWRGFAKGQPFDLDSATGMMSAQTFRMAVLGLFGNEHDREIVKEELHEVIEGLLPVGVLVILSDVTTTSLHVHPEMIDRDVATALGHDHDNVRSNSYTYRDRPRLSEDENVWKERLRQIDQDLSKQVIDMFALTSCVAPVATTYASAACANKMADEASHMIVEREYARIILEWDTDRNGPLETMRPDVILDRALDKANTLINGRSGLMKLVTTLAANAQGAALLGDPPEIYAAINHHSNPALLASLHAGGVAMSEITSLTLVYMYLRNSLGIGVDAKEFVGEFLATQIRATEGLASSVGRFYSQRRALSRGEDMATRIAAILQDSSQDRNISSEDLKKIGDILSSIQPSLVELDIRRYVDLRRRFLQRLKGEKNQFENVIATLEKSDSSIGVDEFEEILGLTPDSLANGLTPDMERKIHRLADHALHRAEQADGQQLAALFESFMAEAAADPLHPRVADADLANSSHADARSHAALLGALSKLGSKLQDTRPADTLKSFFEMDEHGGNASGVDMLAFLDAMTGPKETLQAMVDTFRFPGSHSPE